MYFHYCHLCCLVYLSKNLFLTWLKVFVCCTTSAYFLLCWCPVFSSLSPTLSSNCLSSIHILLVSLLLFIYFCRVALVSNSQHSSPYFFWQYPAGYLVTWIFLKSSTVYYVNFSSHIFTVSLNFEQQKSYFCTLSLHYCSAFFIVINMDQKVIWITFTLPAVLLVYWKHYTFYQWLNFKFPYILVMVTHTVHLLMSYFMHFCCSVTIIAYIV